LGAADISFDKFTSVPPEALTDGVCAKSFSRVCAGHVPDYQDRVVSPVSVGQALHALFHSVIIMAPVNGLAKSSLFVFGQCKAILEHFFTSQFLVILRGVLVEICGHDHLQKAPPVHQIRWLGR